MNEQNKSDITKTAGSSGTQNKSTVYTGSSTANKSSGSGMQSKSNMGGSQSQSSGKSAGSGMQAKSGMGGSQSQSSGKGADKNSSSDKAKESDNVCVLNEIYQNAQMGKQSISNLIPKVEDAQFKKELVSCYESYDQLCSQSASEIMKLGDRPKEKNPLSKAMLWGTINVSTLVNDSPSNIADIMIKGSHNSVNNITRSLNQHSDNIDSEIKNLADKFIQNEQSSISNLQKFL